MNKLLNITMGILRKARSLNHFYVSFVCVIFTLPAMAQCPDGKAEVLLITPSGISKTICVPDNAISGIENAEDHSAGTIDTMAASFIPLGDLDGGSFESAAIAASADGAVIAGGSDTVAGYEAFRWTPDGGMVGLGDLDGGTFESEAHDVSADGTVIVGDGVSDATSSKEAFRWTAATGMVGLGDLDGGSFHSNAGGVSADGTVVVGGSSSLSGNEAFRWTAATGMVGLGDLDGGSFLSEAMGVSADGTVVVGFSSSLSGSEAFRWTADGGMQSLRTLLEAEGIDLTNWSLIIAFGVSDDGKVIVGAAKNPNGDEEAFMATLVH